MPQVHVACVVITLVNTHVKASGLPPVSKSAMPLPVHPAFRPRGRASLLVCIEGPSYVASAAVPAVHIYMCTDARIGDSPACKHSCFLITPTEQRELLAGDLLFSPHDCPTVRRVCTVLEHLLMYFPNLTCDRMAKAMRINHPSWCTAGFRS